MENIRMRCPCVMGLESVIKGELRRLDAQDITVTDGCVEFSGDFNMLARANLNLRSAERVQIVLGSFKAVTLDQLVDGVKALPFEQYIGKNDAFPVKGRLIDTTLQASLPVCQKRVKIGAVKRLGQVYGLEYLPETGTAYQIQFFIHKDIATIVLDTSGPGLHKRGYRQQANIAPIRETLAAGILDIARIYPDTQLYDPCCGSGTMLIEAALKARNIAPGIYRRFAAEKWPAIPQKVWQQERERAKSLIRPSDEVTFKGIGGDIDSDSVALVLNNSRKAGVAKLITATNKNMLDFVPPTEKSLVVCNPPYGERLLEADEAEELCREMGKVFVPSKTTEYFIISSLDDFESLFGRKADKRRKLYNGMVKCQLYMYFREK